MINHKNLLVFHFPYSSQLGGQEKQTLLLFTELRKKHWNIKFIGRRNEILLKLLKQKSFKTKAYDLPRPPVNELSLITFTLLLPFTIFKLIKLIKIIKTEAKQPATVFLMSLGEKIVLTPILLIINIFHLKYKVIWMEHGGARINRYLSWNPYRPFLTFWSRFTTTITVSEKNAREFKSLGFKNCISITNAVKTVSPNKFKTTRKIIIGYAGRLAPDKGINYLLQAITKLKQNQLQLHIAGTGPQETKLKQLAEQLKLNNITWTGKLTENEMNKFYKKLDIFILPSSSPESFGLTAAEAMMHNLPVIITNHIGLSDFIQHEKNGIIIPPRDTAKLAKAITKLIVNKDLRRRIAKSGRQTAITNFSISAMINKYEQILQP